jgi:hypothetical protein
MDYLDLLIKYESDEISNDDFLALFGQLIANGDAWRLQGHYGRVASMLIKDGVIGQDGTIYGFRDES